VGQKIEEGKDVNMREILQSGNCFIAGDYEVQINWTPEVDDNEAVAAMKTISETNASLTEIQKLADSGLLQKSEDFRRYWKGAKQREAEGRAEGREELLAAMQELGLVP